MVAKGRRGRRIATPAAPRHSRAAQSSMIDSCRPMLRRFQPTARQLNLLIPIGLAVLGYALYLRYLVIEQSTVGLACQAGLNTWLCFARQITIALFTYSVFGWFALIAAALNLLRPSLVLFAVSLAAACCGVVLYNAGLSSLATGLLVISLARRAPEPD